MKWSDHNGNWVAPSLSQNLQTFTGSFSGKLVISKKISLKETLHISHGTLNNIRCPSDKISPLEYWSYNLDQKQDVKWSV